MNILIVVTPKTNIEEGQVTDETLLGIVVHQQVLINSQNEIVPVVGVIFDDEQRQLESPAIHYFHPNDLAFVETHSGEFDESDDLE